MPTPKRRRSPSPTQQDEGLDSSFLDVSSDDIVLSPPAVVVTPESSPVRVNIDDDDERTNFCSGDETSCDTLFCHNDIVRCNVSAISIGEESTFTSPQKGDQLCSLSFEGDFIQEKLQSGTFKTAKAAQDTNNDSFEDSEGLVDVVSDSTDSLSEEGSDSNDGEIDWDSEISFSEEDEGVYHNFGDPPVYQGAPVTLNESMAAVLSYIIRHEISGTEIVDLLSLINLHCKEERNKMLTSLYFFKKHFSLLDCPVVYHYYCSCCYAKLKKKDDICINRPEHPESSESAVFVELPLIAQLQALFSQEEFVSNFNHSKKRKKENELNIEDVYDGQLYQELIQNRFFDGTNTFNFSLILNTDGVPVFHSCNKSLWPIFLNVLELPPHLRFKQEYTLIAGLWFGKKPSANFMLAPLLPSFQAMSRGFQVMPFGTDEDVTAKGVVLSATTDLPAKIMLIGMGSYSGAFGCQVCKVKGGSVKIVKKTNRKQPSEESEVKTSSVWVYKYSDALELRSHSETITFGEEAQKLLLATGDSKINVSGVKFPSAIFKIMYDAIRGFAIDDLHTLYLGVTKTLINLWFDSKYSSQPFSIRKHLSTVDKSLQSVMLPNFLERGVVSIEHDLPNWKGKDFLAWLHYLSVILLEGVLPDKYLQHHIDLVSCLQLLQSSSIPRDSLLACERTLNLYVKNFEILYGTRHMSMVIHLLQHLVFVVTNLGPLKYLSCFPYESLNGEMLKMILGTRYIETQLASSTYLIRQLPHRLRTLKQDSDVKNFCEKILHPSKRLKFLESIDSGVFSVGTYKALSKEENHVTASLKEIVEINEVTNLESFLRLKKGKLLFFSRSYKRSTRTNSYTCSFYHNGLLKYGCIDLFVKFSLDANCTFFAIIETADVEPYIIGTKQVNHIQEFVLTGEYVAVQVMDIRDMLVFIEVKSRSFVCNPLDHSLKS